MKTSLSILVLTLSGGMAHAAMDHMPGMSHKEMPAASKAANHSGTGIVKLIDEQAGKLKITHQAIASLDWPVMTMWFALRTAMPANIKVGDAVRFELAQEGKHWVITSITAQ